METSPRYVLVGLSLLALLLSAAGALLWLKKFGEGGKLERYAVYFQHHSLSGLQEGSIVTLRGIPVGSVDSFRFSEENIERIKVILAIEDQAPIKTDTQAVVTRNLLTGLAGIDLVNSSQAAPKLENTQPGESFPVIEEGQGEFDALKSNVPELLERATKVVERMEAVLSEENRVAFTATLENIRKITANVSESEGQLDALLKEVRQTSRSATDVVKSLEKTTVELRNALLPLIHLMGYSTESMTKSITGAARSVAAAAQNFQNPRSIITGPAPANLGPGERMER